MVYRGRSGAGPEKKGEDVFPYFPALSGAWGSTFRKGVYAQIEEYRCPLRLDLLDDNQRSFWLYRFCVDTSETAGSVLGEGYSPTDVLLCDPHTTDVLDVLYHVV